MRTHRPTVTIALILAATLIAQAAAQSQQPRTAEDVIKLSAELVQIDVIVTGKTNKPVPGLKREDFQLFDNDKPQHLTTFAYEQSKVMQFNAEPGESRVLPRAITAAEVKRVIAFVVDTLHMSLSSVYYSQRMLTDFLDHKMEPGDLVLILPTGGGSGLLQQFTANQRLLRRAVNRLRPFGFSGGAGTTTYRRQKVANVRGLFGPPPVGPGQGGGLLVQGAPWLHGDPAEEADVRAAIRTFGNLIKNMGKLPGRKIGVVLSEGFRVVSTQSTAEVNQMTAQAARANIVLYTIDPRGLEAMPDEDFRESQGSLNAIALDTGGKFFHNSNDINKGLENLLEENSGYYLLGFQPEASKWDGKIHKIKVVVRDHPELNVSFRRSYLAKASKPAAPPSTDPKNAEMIEALTSPLVRRDIDLRLSPFYLDDAKRDVVVTALLHIDISRFSFKQADGKYQARFEQMGVIFNSIGKAADMFSQTVDLNLDRQTYEQAIRRGLVFTRALSNLRPGVYQLNMFVREPESGLIGTANDFFEVPQIRGDRLTASSIFTDAREIKDGKIVSTAGEGGTLAQRRFSREGEFVYRLVVYNAKADSKSGKPQLEIRARVLTGGRAVFTGNFRPLEIAEGSTPPSRILTGGVLMLAGLEPDEYTLEITVADRARKQDKNSTVRQEIDFTVE
ncbi:MAG TPA: VWA domain-containing protein [Blastocatellia bacterium]|nr:VWA domain-containing protein [Blastocatellia bacterium]